MAICTFGRQRRVLGASAGLMIICTLDTAILDVTEICLMAEALAAKALHNPIGCPVVLNLDHKVQNSSDVLQESDVFLGFEDGYNP